MNLEAKIIARAGELFTKHGIRNIAMDDIARSLSISKKTIYRYFKNKDQVVTMAVRAYMEMEKRKYGKLADMSGDAVEELAWICRCMRKNFHEMNPWLLIDLQKYYASAWEVWLDFKSHHLKDTVVRNLKKGIEEGHFRKEIDPEFLAVLRVEQVQLIFNTYVFPADKFNLKATQVKLFDHYVHGIVTEKGRRVYEQYLEKEKHSNLNQNQK